MNEVIPEKRSSTWIRKGNNNINNNETCFSSGTYQEYLEMFLLNTTLHSSAESAVSPHERTCEIHIWHLSFSGLTADGEEVQRCRPATWLLVHSHRLNCWPLNNEPSSPPGRPAAPDTLFPPLAVHRGGQGTWAVCCCCSVYSLICGFRMYNQSFLKRADDNLWLHADNRKLYILNWVWGMCIIFR